MDVFDLDEKLLYDYRRFARSFTQIRAKDIREGVDAIYRTNRFWPDPLISINPNFEKGASVADLVKESILHPHTAQIFRIDGAPMRLHRHQEQAVAKAHERTSFVVTTGTGSGKSMCFFIPILDAAVRARVAGEERRTRAIVIYPMNALANSQMEELKKFINQSELPEHLRPTFARYTGQDDAADREAIRIGKPDILLTNFMMIELLMTRQSEDDRQVIANAEGLNFMVLDELHTYRGRQGADVAKLTRTQWINLFADIPAKYSLLTMAVCVGIIVSVASAVSALFVYVCLAVGSFSATVFLLRRYDAVLVSKLTSTQRTNLLTSIPAIYGLSTFAVCVGIFLLFAFVSCGPFVFIVALVVLFCATWVLVRVMMTRYSK